MKLLYYITSHGYGHAARTVALCNKLPSAIEVVFRTTVPEAFFNREMARPFSYAPAQFDCGCIQTDGVTVDIDATLSRYMDIAKANAILLDNEAAMCRKNNVDGIVSDIVPFAFNVAHEAKIPSLAITNFTWHTIYKEYLKDRPDFAADLALMEKQYAMADALLALSPASSMPYFAKAIPAGPIGRKGDNIRDLIAMAFGISDRAKIGLIYIGNFGMNDMLWKDLEQFDEWEFFGLYPLPGAAKNYHCIDQKTFAYRDFAASADVMICKLGYGTCAECFVNGLPIIYLPRRGFAEYECLARAVLQWGHGHELSSQMFRSLQWHNALQSVASRPKPLPAPASGIETCIQTIYDMFDNSQHFA